MDRVRANCEIVTATRSPSANVAKLEFAPGYIKAHVRKADTDRDVYADVTVACLSMTAVIAATYCCMSQHNSCNRSYI